MMHEREKSDPSIVARKPANKLGQPRGGAGGAKGGDRGKHGRAMTRAGRRAGKACPRGLNVYGKQQRQERRNGSPRFCTM